jgi:hypothetical protein
MIAVLAAVGLVGAVSILLRIAMSRPPRRGLAGSVAGRTDSPALPACSVVVPDELAAPQPLAVQAHLDRLAPLPPPDTSVAVLGVDTDTEDNDRKLWLVARERLTKR